MMHAAKSFRGVPGVLGLASLFLVGCPSGPSDEVTCGPNTKEVDGKCVSTVTEAPCADGASRNPDTGQCEPDVECGIGTTYDPIKGTCEPDARCGPNTTLNPVTGFCEPNVVCGPDTTFDPSTGACRPNVVCGEGTHLDGDTGTCVPDENCGTGTTFDPSTGTCVPDLVCGPGLTNVDGVCLSALDLLLEEAVSFETIPDVNDPTLGGEPEPLVLAPLGERVVASGTIQRPVDLDGDDVIDQDRDVWRFSASAGTLLRIRVLTTGAFLPAFALTGPNGYYREPQLGFALDADRQVILPYDGEYDLVVLPSLVLQGVSAPVGGDDAVYAILIEELEWPTPADVSIPSTGAPASAQGRLFDLRDNFFSFSANAAAPVVVEASAALGDTEPVLLFFDSNRAFQREVSFANRSGILTALASAYYDEEAGLIAVLDWRTSKGVDADFELNAHVVHTVDLGPSAPGETLLWPRETVFARDGASFTFEATAGEVVLSDLFGLSTSNSDVVLFAPSGKILFAGSYTINPQPTFVAQETGTYRWLLLNTGDSDVRVAPAIASFTPTLVGPLDADQAESASFSGGQLGPSTRPDGEWFIIETSGPALVRMDFGHTLGTPTFEMYPLSADGTLGARTTRNANSPGTLRRLHEGPERTLLRFSPGATGRTPDPVVLGWSLEVSASPPPTLLEQEPNDSMEETQALTVPVTLRGTIASGEYDYYTVSLDTPLEPGEALEIDVETIAGRATATWLRIREVGSAPEENPRFLAAQIPLSRGYLLPSDNLTSFVLELQGTNADGLEYVLDIRRVNVGPTEVEPNDSEAAAQDLGTLSPNELPVSIMGGLENRASSSGPVFSDYYQLTLSEDLPEGHALRIVVDEVLESSDLDLTISYAGAPAQQVLTTRHEEGVLLAAPAAGTPLIIQVSDTQTGGRIYNIYRLTVDVVPSHDVEPNNSVGTASPLGTFEPGTSVRTFGIGKRLEADYYRIDVDEPLPAGDAFRVRASILTARGNLDLYVVDAAGNTLLRTDRYIGELVFAPTGEAGPFFVQVIPDRSTATTFAELYLLEVERFTTTDVIEVEPNNTLATAQAVSVPATVQASVGKAAPDIFAVTLDGELSAGEVLIVDGFTAFTEDLVVRILDADSNELATTTDVLPYLEVTLPVGDAGTTYYVEVLGSSSLGVDEEQPYELFLDVAAP